LQRIASIEKIASLKALINKARLNYTLPSNQRVVVAFPWLLGFIVGDGCFNFFSPDLSMPQFSKSSRFFILEDTGRSVPIIMSQLFFSDFQICQPWPWDSPGPTLLGVPMPLQGKVY
jgi:hypothetical protein